MPRTEMAGDDLVHAAAAAARLGVSRRTVDRLMADGQLLRAHGPDGRTYITAGSLSALALRRERPLRRGAAKDEVKGLLSALERLVGAVGDDRAALMEAVREREQAREQAAELRGQLAVERARARRLEELLLAVAADRADSSAVARSVLSARDGSVQALSEPADAAGAADRLFERALATADEPKSAPELRAAFASQLEHVRDAEPEASSRWAAWRDGLDVPGSVYERLLPGPERRAAGQFGTPYPLADVMLAWLLQEPTRRLLDPAVGSGRLLFRAFEQPRPAPVQVIGWDSDELAVAMAELNLRLRGIPRFRLHLADFLADVDGPAAAELAEDPPDAVIANPPWSRHLALSPEYKHRVHESLERRLGISLQRQAGLHALFLVRALEVAAPGARLAFLTPAGWLDATYGRAVQKYLLEHAHVEGYVTLSRQRLAFDGVLASAAMTLLRKTPDPSAVTKVVDLGDGKPEPARVLAALSGEDTGLPVREVRLSRASSLSRRSRRRSPGVALIELAHVHRGIATGHNRFFVISEALRRERGIETAMLRPCLYQPRLFPGLEIRPPHLDELASERPRWILDPPEDFQEFADSPLGEYLAWGKRELRVHERRLCQQRPSWFRPEVRGACPIVVGVFHKHNSVRFTRNYSGAVPVASFYIIEPKSSDPLSIDALWRGLNEPALQAEIRALGRGYGNGAWKVEVSNLARLTIPRASLSAS